MTTYSIHIFDVKNAKKSFLAHIPQKHIHIKDVILFSLSLFDLFFFFFFFLFFAPLFFLSLGTVFLAFLVVIGEAMWVLVGIKIKVGELWLGLRSAGWVLDGVEILAGEFWLGLRLAGWVLARVEIGVGGWFWQRILFKFFIIIIFYIFIFYVFGFVWLLRKSGKRNENSRFH